jgi:hypothetical protein
MPRNAVKSSQRGHGRVASAPPGFGGRSIGSRSKSITRPKIFWKVASSRRAIV